MKNQIYINMTQLMYKKKKILTYSLLLVVNYVKSVSKKNYVKSVCKIEIKYPLMLF
jgi:hypothetical protein